LYGPPSDCKQYLWGGWIGLRKCIRPVCGAGPLAMMESARRWSTKWVELGWFLFPHRLEQRRLRPFLSLIDLSCKPEGVESMPVAAAPAVSDSRSAASLWPAAPASPVVIHTIAAIDTDSSTPQSPSARTPGARWPHTAIATSWHPSFGLRTQAVFCDDRLQHLPVKTEACNETLQP
jgi:hypothetical protein